MKLVIELDEVAYDLLTGKIETANIDLFSTLIKSVQNGTPLSEELKKLKAEIEKENESYITMWETGFDDVSYGKYRAYRKAIGIIVKHIDELEGE